MVTKEEFKIIYEMGVRDTKHNLRRLIDDAYAKYITVTSNTKQFTYSALPLRIQSRFKIILHTYLQLNNLDKSKYKPMYLEKIKSSSKFRLVYHDLTNNVNLHIDVMKDLFDIDESEIYSKLLYQFH